MGNTADKQIAMLIDSDNISKKYFSVLIDELNKFGTVVQKRIYGDFTKPKANGWGDAILEFAIEPMQQYACVSGKNATDSAMIIDAMDILYKGKINCVCLATSDSDFTKLATRFRSDNIMVIGAGTKNAPLSFRAACDRFLLMDVLLEDNKIDKSQESKVGKTTTTTGKKAKAKDDKPAINNLIASKKDLVAIAKSIIDDEGDAEGSMLFALFMSALYKKDNTFNPKNYGEPSRPIPFFKNFEVDGKKPFEIAGKVSAESIKITKKQ